MPTPNSAPLVIMRGPDGAYWFTQLAGNKIGRIDRHGSIVEFPIPTPNSQPDGIVLGPDGNLWFAQILGNKIGRITPQGEITEFLVPTPGVRPTVITVGPDGALWFTERGAPPAGLNSGIGRITVDGEITAGPDGALWFTQILGNRIGRLTTEGQLTEFPLPTPGAFPNVIAPGPERGTLVFSEQAAGKIGRITVDGKITEFALDPASQPVGLTAGSGMDVWIAQVGANAIARLHIVRAMGPAHGCPPPHTPATPSGICRTD